MFFMCEETLERMDRVLGNAEKAIIKAACENEQLKAEIRLYRKQLESMSKSNSIMIDCLQLDHEMVQELIKTLPDRKD